MIAIRVDEQERAPGRASPILAGVTVIIATLIFVLVSLISARTQPVGLYEPDLYAATGLVTWIAAAAALGLPLAVFVGCVARRADSERLTHLLVLSYALANVGFSLIPWVRYPAGYDRWDGWYHYAETVFILDTGHTSPTNYYPATHLILATAAESLGVSPAVLAGAFPAFTNGLLVLSAYGASRWLKLTTNQAFVAALAVPALALLPAVFPLAVSFVFLVWLAAILVNFDPDPYRLLLFLVMFAALVVTHLLTAISVVVGLASLLVVSKRGLAKSANPALIAGVLVLAWVFWMTQVYISPARLIAQIIATGTFESRNYGSILAGVGLSGFDALRVVLELVAARLVLACLSLPALFSGLRALLRRSRSHESALVAWALSNAIVLLLLGSLFGSGQLGTLLDRFLNYGLVAVVFLAGMIRYGAHTLAQARESRPLVAGVAILGIALVVAQTAFFYPAPVTGQYNFETSGADVAGLSWVASHVPGGLTVVGSDYNDAILTGIVGSTNATSLGFTFGMSLPSHLACVPGSQPTADIVIVTQFDVYVYGRRGQLFPSDISCLSSSGVYDTVYENGEYTVFVRADI